MRVNVKKHLTEKEMDYIDKFHLLLPASATTKEEFLRGATKAIEERHRLELDLLVHHRGTPEQQKKLDRYYELDKFIDLLKEGKEKDEIEKQEFKYIDEDTRASICYMIISKKNLLRSQGIDISHKDWNFISEDVLMDYVHDYIERHKEENTKNKSEIDE